MDDLRKDKISDFTAWADAHITGDEKGEAQIFLDRLFHAFGQRGIKEAGATLEMRVKKAKEVGDALDGGAKRADAGGTAFADLVWKPIVLIEMKRRGSDLRKHYRQAFDYWTRLVPGRPRYAVLHKVGTTGLVSQLHRPLDTMRAVAYVPEAINRVRFKEHVSSGEGILS